MLPPFLYDFFKARIFPLIYRRTAFAIAHIKRMQGPAGSIFLVPRDPAIELGPPVLPPFSFITRFSSRRSQSRPDPVMNVSFSFRHPQPPLYVLGFFPAAPVTLLIGSRNIHFAQLLFFLCHFSLIPSVSFS